jgi:hypothetical protein
VHPPIPLANLCGEDCIIIIIMDGAPLLKHSRVPLTFDLCTDRPLFLGQKQLLWGIVKLREKTAKLSNTMKI